ncbi:hypothetical protein Tco_1487271, partial [Tanacetum coccineum]
MDKVDHISLPELDEAEKEVEEDVELDLDDDEMIILKKIDPPPRVFDPLPTKAALLLIFVPIVSNMGLFSITFGIYLPLYFFGFIFFQPPSDIRQEISTSTLLANLFLRKSVKRFKRNRGQVV